MTRLPLSRNFAAAEFDCHDGTAWPPAARAALEYWAAVWGEPLRAKFGPVRVTSGFRTGTYNRAVGGAAESFHRYDLRYGRAKRAGLELGVAADVVPARGNPRQWQDWARARASKLRASSATVAGVPTKGRLAAVAYPAQGFIHLDTGPNRTWVG